MQIMGVVYSSIELQEGRIPRDGHHLEAALGALLRLRSHEAVRLTTLHGSVVENRANTRSDLDVLVTYNTEEPWEEPQVIRDINSVFDDINARTHVKIEANIWPANESIRARRERMYDLLFSRHLDKSMRDVVWSHGAPDQTVAAIANQSYEADLRKVILNYTTYKHGGFTKAPNVFTDSDKSLSAFQRALEFPKAADRKIKQYLEQETGHSDDEHMVSMGLLSHVVEAVDALRGMDKEYTALLSGFEPGALMRNDRKEYLLWLEAHYPKAIDLGIVATTGFTDYVCQL